MAEYVIPDGTPYPDAIRDMVRRRLPDVGFEMKHPTKLVTPGLVYGLMADERDDPWADAEDLACAIGMRLRFRGNRVQAYIPLRERVRMVRWKYVTYPLRKLRRRINDRLHPPVEWPDPDYSD